jgi:surface-anchored protein
MTWTLHGVEGPGHFVLFSNGEFGTPEVMFDSAEPFPQEAGVDADTHVHGNWAFSRAGAYVLDISMSATTRDGEPVSDRRTLRFLAGDGDAAAALEAMAPRRESESAGTAPWLVGGGVVAVLAVAVLLVARRGDG